MDEQNEHQTTNQANKLKLCGVYLCDRAAMCKGFCAMHYQALRAGRITERADGKGFDCAESKRGEDEAAQERREDEIIEMRTSFGEFEDWVYLAKTCELLNIKEETRYTLYAAKQRWRRIGDLIANEKIRSCYTTVFEPDEPRFVGRNFNLFDPRKFVDLPDPDESVKLTDFNETLLRNLAGQHFEYLVQWLAYGFAKPGKLSTSLVLHGVPGSGKSTLARLLRYLYGPYAYTVVGAGIESEFNAWLENKLLIIAEEVTAEERRERVKTKNRLKAWVVPGQIEINRKGVSQYPVENKARWLFLSNDRHPLDIEDDDRRYSVIYGKTKIHDGFGGVLDYDTELHRHAENLLHYLATVGLANFSPYQPLQNDDRKAVQAESRQSKRTLHVG